MKILIVTRNYYPEDSIVDKIALGFVHRGHTVSVLTGKPNRGHGYVLPGYQNISYELLNGIKVHRVDVVPRRRRQLSIYRNHHSFYKNSRKWVRRTKEIYDVVLSIGKDDFGVLSAGNLYKKLHNVPHIAYICDVWPDKPIADRDTMRLPPFFFLYYLPTRNTYKKVDHLIIGSEIYRDYFKNVMKLKKVEMTYVPRAALLKEGLVDPYPYKKGCNIVYYGPLDELHRLELLPEAMRKVANPDIYIHLYGKGKVATSLLKHINELGLEERIILHGDKPINEMPNYFANADACFISSSTRHYTGRALSDELIVMMANKKPIIAMVEGDSENILKESGGGFLLKENVDDLVFAISKTASTSKDVLLEKGEKNYEYFLKHFDISVIIAQIESVLLKKCL